MSLFETEQGLKALLEAEKASINERRGWDIEQLSEKSGVGVTSIKNLLKKGTTRSEEIVWALQAALDLDLPELLGFTGGQLTTGQSLLLSRLEAHMIVKELAAESGVQPGNIWSYENDAMPRLDAARQIAAALDQSIERVFFRYIGILE